MSKYVWLAHSGDYEDYRVWGVFASVEAWWEQKLPDFLEECPNVVMAGGSRQWGDGYDFHPTCHCTRVEREFANWSYVKDHGVMTRVNRFHIEKVHPHEDHFNSAGLYRSEIIGSIPLVKPEQAEFSGAYEADQCDRCGRDEGTPHADDCTYTVEFTTPLYVDPKICTWKKAGFKCPEEAVEGDDQFCPNHLSIVLAVRVERQIAVVE